MIADGHTTFLTYLVDDPDPNWDGTSITVKDPASGATETVAIVCFGAFASTFGPPHWDALEGHRLWGKGLSYHAAHRVIDSAWIAELELRDRADSAHRPAYFMGLTHHVLTFHDETFECVARSHTVEVVTGTYADILRGVVDQLTWD